MHNAPSAVTLTLQAYSTVACAGNDAGQAATQFLPQGVYQSVPPNTWFHMSGTIGVPDGCSVTRVYLGQLNAATFADGGAATVDGGELIPDLYVDDFYLVQ
jgi:hypothetical protein